ncbi:MAG: hypothetical protein Kow00127_10290 [Bacteroidales bacterium]
MKQFVLFLSVAALFAAVACDKENNPAQEDTTDQISVDSLVASLFSVKAWDTTTITCYARGSNLVYGWECDHGNFNGGGNQIKYAAGECCVGVNTITCTVSNETGHVVRQIQIEVTSYFGGGK